MENSTIGTEEGKAAESGGVRAEDVIPASGERGGPISDPLGSMGQVIQINEKRIQSHMEGVVRDTVEQTLNSLLAAEADRACGAKRYERNAARRDTRAGHYALSCARAWTRWTPKPPGCHWGWRAGIN